MSDGIVVWGPGERRPNDPGKRNKWCIIRVPINGRDREKVLKGITDPEEARSIAREYLGEAKEAPVEQQRGPTSGPGNFRELAERYAAAKRITRHERARVGKLVACPIASLGCIALGDVPVADLTPALAKEAALRLYGSRVAKTMNRAAVSPFAAIVHFGAEELLCMPYMRVSGFKVVERLTPRLAGGEDDVQRLLKAAAAARPSKGDRYWRDHPYRHVLLLFLFRQGWRISETLRLQWRQVDLVNGKFRNVVVDKGLVVKPTLPINAEVYEALAGLPEGEPQRADRERRGRVFPWVNHHNVYRWLIPFCDDDVGIRFRPHMARVEFASQLNEAGSPEAVIRDTCTWKGTRAINRYTRTDEAAAQAAIDCLGRRDADSTEAQKDGARRIRATLDRGR